MVLCAWNSSAKEAETGGLSGSKGQSLMILGFHKMRSCLKKQNRLLVAYAFNSSTHEAEAGLVYRSTKFQDSQGHLMAPWFKAKQKPPTNFMI